MAPRISDDALLKTNAAATVLLGLPAMVAPKLWHNAFFMKDHPNNPELGRFWGLNILSCGASALIVSDSDNPKAKKRFLKTAGAAWVLAGALTANNVRTGAQPKESGTVAAVGSALMGGALLAGGLRKD
ncbi:hypothetical protein HYH03_008901 [Edaphochlamys debaryana]|uniref:Uncharacterized protein n=1 Tax=Edaphochlamys debaryana TaxID=47281 RepID=A0A835XZ97_9CHLO|nr:hypothetical protein HYH03_008901 [Edaphochlamys debaryana]|eukprot:KAG2492735.1 hypothetical protein HYH03_008901 [Edaphochlamys debaryana]